MESEVSPSPPAPSEQAGHLVTTQRPFSCRGELSSLEHLLYLHDPGSHKNECSNPPVEWQTLLKKTLSVVLAESGNE